jgi:hypothetical protein
VFVNERGSQCTYEGKGAVSGGKKKRKTTNQVARALRVQIQEKRGPPHVLQARGGPCAPVRKGERSGGRRKKKRNLMHCFGLWWGEKSRRSGRVVRPRRVMRCERGGPLCTCKMVSKERKKKEKEKREGSSQSPERRHVTERGKGECMSQSNVGRARPKAWCKGRGRQRVAEEG